MELGTPAVPTDIEYDGPTLTTVGVTWNNASFDNERTGYGSRWDTAGATIGSDYAQLAFAAGTAIIEVGIYVYSIITNDCDVYWVISGVQVPLKRCDIAALTWMSFSNGSLGYTDALRQANYQRFIPPDGATAIRFYPNADNTDNRFAIYDPEKGSGDFSNRGTKPCVTYAAATPGDADWEWVRSRLLETQGTSDDVALRFNADSNFCTGPAHSNETYSTPTLTIDGGGDIWGTISTGGDPGDTTGTSILLTLDADVYRADDGGQSSKKADLVRTFTFTDGLMASSHAFTNCTDTATLLYASMFANDTDGFANETNGFWFARLGGSTCIYVGALAALNNDAGLAGLSNSIEMWGGRTVGLAIKISRSDASVWTATTRKSYTQLDAGTLWATGSVSFSATWQFVDRGTIANRSGTVYVDTALQVDEQMASDLSGKTIKVDGVALTLESGEVIDSAYLTTYRDTVGATINTSVAYNTTTAPAGSPTAGDWTGIVNSGTVTNCHVEYATAGVARTAGVLANTIIDNCTDVTTGSGGSESGNLTDGSHQLDSLGIPVRGGNCDVGRGDPTIRPLGSTGFYGRPKLRPYADCIGPIYPQRRSPENILYPLAQYPSEMV